MQNLALAVDVFGGPLVDRPSPVVEIRNDNVLYLTAPDGSSIMTPGLQMPESQA